MIFDLKKYGREPDKIRLWVVAIGFSFCGFLIAEAIISGSHRYRDDDFRRIQAAIYIVIVAIRWIKFVEDVRAHHKK